LSYNSGGVLSGSLKGFLPIIYEGKGLKGSPALRLALLQELNSRSLLILDEPMYGVDEDNLRLLIVVEEAHLWTSKDMPREATKFLDSAVRLLRKKGVGVMLISQKISDFDPAMRSAMNASILFRTKYEGDLRAIARMLGTEMSAVIPRLPVSYSVFHLADIGDSFVLALRPTYSQP
jgi:DNA helicase HerA-like ATPase